MISSPSPGPTQAVDPVRGTEPRPDSTRLEHQAADRELFARLVECGFDKDSDAWRELAWALVEYATGVLMPWAMAGNLRSKALKYRGGARLPEDLELDGHGAQAVVNEVLVIALEHFRQRSLRVWDPKGGASLATWFVNQCLLDLPDAYARWWRKEGRPFPVEICVIDDGRHCQRPDEEAEARVLVDQVLADDPDLRRVLELQDAGYSRDEIAEALGQTVGSLRSKVNRAKQRIRKEVN